MIDLPSLAIGAVIGIFVLMVWAALRAGDDADELIDAKASEERIERALR